MALLAMALAAAWPTDVFALFQQGGDARLVAFTNEPREPEFGQVFALVLSLRFAPGVVAFVPDTLRPSQDAFSAGKGTWTTAAGPADSVDVQATYPVMGLLNGGVELPTLELWTRRADAGETPGPRPASEMDDMTAAEKSALTERSLEIGGVLVLVPAEMAGESAALPPRPPADVLGGEWSVWLITAVAASIVAVVALAWILIANLRAAARARDGAGIGASARAEALHELDRLLALGWHTDGRIAEFYDATTHVLRHLSERREPAWRRALTSTELVGRIEGRFGAGSVERLRPAISTAEYVKFGAHEPEPPAAEQHWSAVRDWISALPEA